MYFITISVVASSSLLLIFPFSSLILIPPHPPLFFLPFPSPTPPRAQFYGE